jgi:outer membrane protein OmpA-like peptidoglycan-associated protein
MNQQRFKSSIGSVQVAAVVLGLTACTTMEPNPTLESARRGYQAAQADQQIAKFAPVELKQASDALARAEAAESGRETPPLVDHLAYVAKQQVALAESSARLRAAEQEVNEAGAAREKLRLSARTAEAERARAEAEEAKRHAAEAQSAAKRGEAVSEQERARIAQLEEQLKAMNAKQTERGLVITLGDVLFQAGKAKLGPHATRNLDRLVTFLGQYPQRKVMVEGFADSTGSEERNLTLSEKRAEAVRVYLERKGIPGERIETKGYGEAFPVGSNETKAGREANRRVEIVVSDEKGQIKQRNEAAKAHSAPHGGS